MYCYCKICCKIILQELNSVLYLFTHLKKSLFKKNLLDIFLFISISTKVLVLNIYEILGFLIISAFHNDTYKT